MVVPVLFARVAVMTLTPIHSKIASIVMARVMNLIYKKESES